MATPDPFGVLGVSPDADIETVKRAWRTLAREFHPDSGGSHAEMTRLNEALRDALSTVEERSAAVPRGAKLEVVTARVVRDVSSFTVNVLPVDCWLGLEVVAGEFGPVIHEEPPYVLEFLLHDSNLEFVMDAWCRCELVPEAGATMVHLTVGTSPEGQAPPVVDVRDALIDSLNSIDWP